MPKIEPTVAQRAQARRILDETERADLDESVAAILAELARLTARLAEAEPIVEAVAAEWGAVERTGFRSALAQWMARLNYGIGRAAIDWMRGRGDG